MAFKSGRSLWLALTAVIVCGAVPLAARAQSTNLLSGGDTVFVSYDNGTNGPLAGNSPTVNLGFGDSTAATPFLMDTGSTGIVASADLFQPGPGAVNLGPGSQTYSSSGVVENGTWYAATREHLRFQRQSGRDGRRAGAPGHQHHLPARRARLQAR